MHLQKGPIETKTIMKASDLIKEIEKVCNEKGYETSDLDICIVDTEENINENFEIAYCGTDIPAVFLKI